jgi:large subunit ribosomal protein L25
MQEYKLNILNRESVGRGPAKRLRQQGRIPASLYGQGKARSVSVSSDEFRALKGALSGKTALIELTDGAGVSAMALVQEIQRDAIRDTIKHVDFLHVEQGQKFKASVPLHIVDEDVCIGVMESAGALDQKEREVEVRCTPESLPTFIELSVADLAAGDSITVADVTAPNGVEFLGAGARVLITCQA